MIKIIQTDYENDSEGLGILSDPVDNCNRQIYLSGDREIDNIINRIYN